MRTSLAGMKNAELRLRSFVKTKDRLPGYVMMQDMDKKTMEKVPIDAACGMFYGYYNFWLKNNRFPNFTTRNILKSEPTILDHQNNKFNCFPCSLGMLSTKLFNPKREVDLATIFHTTTSGTNPDNLAKYDQDAGFIITPMERTTQNVINALTKYHGVINHFETGDPDADCAGFENNYGHYEVIKTYANGQYLCWDPTKGAYWCRADSMNKATNGRSIKFYEVRLA